MSNSALELQLSLHDKTYNMTGHRGHDILHAFGNDVVITPQDTTHLRIDNGNRDLVDCGIGNRCTNRFLRTKLGLKVMPSPCDQHMMYVPQIQLNQQRKTIQYNSAAAAWIQEYAPNETTIHLIITYRTLGYPVAAFTYIIQPKVRRVTPRNLYQYGREDGDDLWKGESGPIFPLAQPDRLPPPAGVIRRRRARPGTSPYIQ